MGNKKTFATCFMLVIPLFLFMMISCISSPKQNLSFPVYPTLPKEKELVLSKMTTEEKVSQLFIIRPENLLPSDQGIKKITNKYLKEVEKYPVGGFVIFKQNIENPSQLRELNLALKKSCPIPPIISVDEEGGRVARLANSKTFFLPIFTSMEEVGKTGDIENARGAGQIIGSYLKTFGFDMNFAPDADVNTNPENIVIGNRAFGSDPILVSKMVSSFLSGLHSTGIKGCIKHFPGHGDTKGDTHKEYVSITKTWDELKSCEFIPFTENFSLTDSIMMAHVTLTCATKDGLPASLSYELITEKLRGELGYDGLIITDAMEMGAIVKNYGAGKAALLAFLAGNDIILLPNDFHQAYSTILSAVKDGTISEERLNQSILRILKLKGFN